MTLSESDIKAIQTLLVRTFDDRLVTIREDISIRMQSFDDRLQQFDGRMQHIDERMQSFDQRLGTAQKDISMQIQCLSTRVQGLDERIDTVLDDIREFRGEVNESFDYLFKQDERQQHETLATNEQLKRIEQTISGHELRINALENQPESQ